MENAPQDQTRPNIIAVPLNNSFSGRPKPAFLHAAVSEDGRTKLWIEGVNIGNFDELVGPERAVRHRQSFTAQDSERGNFVRRIVQRFS